KNTRSPMAIEPLWGVSSPAMARSNVVLPLPDGPSNATTWPAGTATETPLRISLSPRRRATSLTVSSAMQAYSKADCDGQADANHEHINDRQGRHQVDSASPPERHEKRADDLGAGAEQIDARGIFTHEDQENQKPACEHSVFDQRYGHVTLHAQVVSACRACCFLQFRGNLEQGARNKPHPVGKPDNRVGEPDRYHGRLQRRQKRHEK